MEVKVSGLSCYPNPWSKRALELARLLIAERREVFKLEPDELKGRRYHDDEHVILLLRSSCPEELYGLAVEEWTDAALHAAASADAWYHSEKDYGDDGLQEEPDELEDD